MVEKWKAINGYEGLYEVSNHGKVRTAYGVILKGQANGDYRDIVLTKNKIRKKYKVHRLVAEAFVPNPYGFPIINHIDECPSNNNAENLEWCTYKYNTNYGTCVKRRAVNHYKPVNQYSGEVFVKRWKSIMTASKCLGINSSSITKVAKGKRKTAGGFGWRYDS